MDLRSSPFARILIAVCLACLTQGALANASFVLSLRGTGLHFPAPGGFCDVCPPPEEFSWTGTVTVVTSSGADGIYTGNEVSSVSVVSQAQYGSFNYTLNSPWNIWSLDVPFIHSSEPTVEVRDGVVRSLDLTWEWDPSHMLVEQTLWFDRLSAYLSITGWNHGGEIFAQGSLTPIPEPGAYALMLAGIGLVGFAARGRRRT
jgi:hypothetical protein